MKVKSESEVAQSCPTLWGFLCLTCLVSIKYRILICCTCCFQSSSLFFVYFLLIFLFLQVSSLCNFCPDTGGEDGHLCRLTCSVALCGGRDIANKYRWRVWGLLAVYGPHWVCPSSRRPVLPGSTPPRLQVALQGPCPKPALHFVHFPGRSPAGSRILRKGTDVHFVPFPGPSSSGDQVLGECTVPSGLCIFVTALVPATQFPGCAARALSQVFCASPLGSWSQAATLLADVNHPGSQEDVVRNWEPARGSVQDALMVSGRGCRSPLPSGSGCGMPPSVSRVGRRALYTASYLSFCICLILCSVCRPGCLLEPFTGNCSFLCLSGDPAFWVPSSP